MTHQWLYPQSEAGHAFGLLRSLVFLCTSLGVFDASLPLRPTQLPDCCHSPLKLQSQHAPQPKKVTN